MVSMVLLQAVLNGVVLGGIYLIMAVGLTLVFGVLRVINFAHGEFYTLGAFAMLIFYSQLELPYYLAFPLAVIAVGIIGVIIEQLVLKPFRSDELNGMITTLGIAIMLQSIVLIAFGPTPTSVPSPVGGIVRLGPIIFPASRLFVLAFALVLFVTFWVVLNCTRLGRAMRALVQDPETAQIQGIVPNRIIPVAFGIGVGLAAAGGCLMAPLFSVSPFIGAVPMLKAFIVVILGGIGSVSGAALGGVLLGLTESIIGTYWGATIADLVQLLLVILILLVRPSGLLGQGAA